MKTTLSFAGGVVLLAGCQSPEAREAGGAVATTAAILASAPLAPLAGVYHALSGDIRKDRERTLALHARYDPIYAARIEMLSKRDPVTDARAAFVRGEAMRLPWTRRLPPGRGEGEISDELKSLVVAVITDPLEPEQVMWLSETYNHFSKVAANYRSAFNAEIDRLLSEKEPNQ